MGEQYMMRLAIMSTYNEYFKDEANWNNDKVIARAAELLNGCEEYMCHLPNHRNSRRLASIEHIHSDLERRLNDVKEEREDDLRVLRDIFS